jgi:hypothetical protein
VSEYVILSRRQNSGLQARLMGLKSREGELLQEIPGLEKIACKTVSAALWVCGEGGMRENVSSPV